MFLSARGLVCALLISVAFATANLRTLRVAHQKRGILTLSFDPSSPPEESLKLLSTTQAGHEPGWLRSRGDKLYSISRTQSPTSNSDSAGIFIFDKLTDGRLHLVDTASSHGNGGVFIDISPDGKTLASANIDGSTVSVFPLLTPDRLGNVTYTFRYNLTQPGPGTGDSQGIANPHCAVFHPSGELMVVADRGSDRLYVYEVHGPKHVKQIRNMTLPLGSGPRHILFSKQSRKKSLMYLVNELSNTINVYSVQLPYAAGRRKAISLNDTLEITQLQTVSTLDSRNAPTKPLNNDLASELALTHDGHFLYVSNRNTESLDKIDTLSVFSVDPKRREPLQFIGLNSTHGKIPRHFSLSPDRENRFVAVANQVTNDLMIMERDVRSGFLGRVVGNYSFGDVDITTRIGPMAVIWG